MGEPLGRCPSRLPAGDRRRAAAEQQRLGHVVGEVGDLAVERARGAEAERPARTTHAIDDATGRDRHRGAEGAAQIEQHERHLVERTRGPPRLLVDRQHRGAHLLRRAHVHAVHLPMRGHARQVYHAGRENHRERRAS
jgi:hypothetical protein